MDGLVLNVINAFQLGMLIFLLALGLTLIFGMMDYLSLAHGAFFTIGAYAGLVASKHTGSFALALASGFLVPALLGALFQRFLLEPLVRQGRNTHLDVALFTLGFAFAVMGAMEHAFGPAFASIPVPEALRGTVSIVGQPYPLYRLFVVGLGLTIGGALWLALDRTVVGAVVRATVDDRDMVVGMGVNASRLFAAIFGIGCGLAGLAGVAAAPVLSIYSHMGMEILIVTLIVVVVGGFGSIGGSFAASLLIGLVNTFSQAYLPWLEPFAMYGVLAIILAVMPDGLFSLARRAA
jgi:branched-chain amino acid transport system permease protein